MHCARKGSICYALQSFALNLQQQIHFAEFLLLRTIAAKKPKKNAVIRGMTAFFFEKIAKITQ